MSSANQGSASREQSRRRPNLFVQWWGLWVLLALGGIVALAWLLPHTLRLFGLGGFTVPIWLWLLFKVTLGGRWRWVSRRPQLWLAALVWQAALQGLLAFYHEPPWFTIGTVSIFQVSSGGLIGQAIAGNSLDWVGVARVASLAVLGIVVMAPREFWHFLQAFRYLGPAAVFLARSLRATVGIIFSILSWFFRGLWKFSTFLTRVFTRLLPLIVRRRRAADAAPPPEFAPQTREPREAMPLPPRREATPAPAPSAHAPIPQGQPQPKGTATRATAAAPATASSPWPLPALELLEKSPLREFDQADHEERAKLIVKALREYGVDARVAKINPGPVVTQFGVEPGWDKKERVVVEKDAEGRSIYKNGRPQTKKEVISQTRVKVERITALASNLALALAVPSVRIEAPVPGQPYVGIEVPNRTFNVVGLRGAIEGATFKKLQVRSKLTLALGRGAGGEVVVTDLAKMPHLLIAGATGSGKTVCLNAAIACLLMHATPEEVRMVMIDPKRVELTPYNYIPHLLSPVIVETDQAIEALKRLNREMDTRYKKLASISARNVEVYNREHAGKNGPMPYITVFVDELADLMMAAPDVVEPLICRLAQLARATGIHLVVATQRPSVDVVTGLIKANFPTRISFAVTSQVDSRTILDGVGAEKLLGRGDMLYLPTDASKPKRLQGVYVSDQEIDRIVAHWRRLGDANYQDQVASAFASLPAQVSEADPLLERARQLARDHTRLSASFLQRRLQIGYTKAQELMEALEDEAIARDKGKAAEESPPGPSA
ncbi:MAG: DNA translocase FtsK [Chloroflexi bacterium]|nr:DNA translocase FtsK [Chloroflexota bacterium]